MPTPAELELWQAFNDKKPNEINSVIKKYSNENLVNSLDATGNTFAMAFFLTPSPEMRTKENVSLILAQPTLNFSYQHPRSGYDLAYSLLRSDDVSVAAVDLLKDNHNFLWNGNKLAYESAKEVLAGAKKSYDFNLNMKPINQNKLENTKSSLDYKQKIVSMVRDVTLLFAIAKDDVELLNKMVTAGADLSQQFGEYGNNLSFDFILNKNKENCPKIFSWFESKRSASSAVNPARTPHGFMSPFQRLKALEEEKSNHIVERDTEVVKLLDDHAKEKIERIQGVLKSSK